MATQIQFRRGTNTEHQSFTGATGELTVNTTNKSVHVHDGTTVSGFELAKVDLSNSTGVVVTGIVTATSFSGDGSSLTGIDATALKDSGGSTIVQANSSGVVVTGIVTATDFNSTSDLNLKENIRPVENSINIINNIEGVRFTWKSDSKDSIGVIAQEVEQVLPELVSNGEIKTVNYNGIIGVLIEAVKEQQKQIEILKSDIHDLKKTLEGN